MDLQLIKELSDKEQKNYQQMFIKLSEECGELAQEILIAENAFGSRHKKAGHDGVNGETVDVILVALSLFFKNGGTMEELNATMAKKCQKWQAVMAASR